MVSDLSQKVDGTRVHSNTRGLSGDVGVEVLGRERARRVDTTA